MQLKRVLLAITLCATWHTQAQCQAAPKKPKQKAFQAARMENDSAAFFRKAEQFLRDYPMATANFEQDRKENIDYFRLIKMLISRSGNADSALLRYYDVLPYDAVLDEYLHRVETPARYDLEKAENMLYCSSLLMRKLESWRKERPVEFKNRTDSEWLQHKDPDYYDCMQWHVCLLSKTGKTEEGLHYAKIAHEHYGYKISRLNEAYVLLLQQAGLTDSMKVVAERAMHENQATPAIIAVLKQLHHNDADFDSYIASLKSEEGKKEMETTLRKAMIKKKFAPFTLYDQHGNLVNTRDWKGKVVVVDYFASWCGPCKASFPGMKMAMEHFVNDKDVLFFYIDTKEEDPVKSKPQVLQYMKDNNFPFTILFDKEGKKKGYNDYAAALMGVSDIPRKFVLDRQGNVRFDKEGNSSSVTELADELIMMINLAKQAN